MNIPHCRIMRELKIEESSGQTALTAILKKVPTIICLDPSGALAPFDLRSSSASQHIGGYATHARITDWPLSTKIHLPATKEYNTLITRRTKQQQQVAPSGYPGW
jgi:hypothetical protein